MTTSFLQESDSLRIAPIGCNFDCQTLFCSPDTSLLPAFQDATDGVPVVPSNGSFSAQSDDLSPTGKRSPPQPCRFRRFVHLSGKSPLPTTRDFSMVPEAVKSGSCPRLLHTSLSMVR